MGPQEKADLEGQHCTLQLIPRCLVSPSNSQLRLNETSKSRAGAKNDCTTSSMLQLLEEQHINPNISECKIGLFLWVYKLRFTKTHNLPKETMINTLTGAEQPTAIFEVLLLSSGATMPTLAGQVIIPAPPPL